MISSKMCDWLKILKIRRSYQNKVYEKTGCLYWSISALLTRVVQLWTFDVAISSSKKAHGQLKIAPCLAFCTASHEYHSLFVRTRHFKELRTIAVQALFGVTFARSTVKIALSCLTEMTTRTWLIGSTRFVCTSAVRIAPSVKNLTPPHNV